MGFVNITRHRVAALFFNAAFPNQEDAIRSDRVARISANSCRSWPVRLVEKCACTLDGAAFVKRSRRHASSTLDGRTKIMELPSIGVRLNYTRRSYSATLYVSHACACTSLPRIRLTAGTTRTRKRYLVYRAERARMSSRGVSYFPILYDSNEGRAFSPGLYKGRSVDRNLCPVALRSADPPLSPTTEKLWYDTL